MSDADEMDHQNAAATRQSHGRVTIGLRQLRTGVAFIGAALGAGLVVLPDDPVWADAPAGRYSFQGASPDDTVTDTQTGLVWQRTSSATSYTWADAATHCAALGGGWRVPSVKELQTLVDDTRTSPAADLTAFPDTPVYLWTSSSHAASSFAWHVNFTFGFPNTSDVGAAYPVRCVR